MVTLVQWKHWTKVRSKGHGCESRLKRPIKCVSHYYLKLKNWRKLEWMTKHLNFNNTVNEIESEVFNDATKKIIKKECCLMKMKIFW